MSSKRLEMAREFFRGESGAFVNALALGRRVSFAGEICQQSQSVRRRAVVPCGEHATCLVYAPYDRIAFMACEVCSWHLIKFHAAVLIAFLDEDRP
jgi:hypothetical protein